MGLILFPFIGEIQSLLFMGYLFITHFVIDGITSRITSKLWKANNMHWFFVIVGFDQLLHALVILLILSQIA